MKTVKVGIIGTGNIGTDLLMKILRSDVLTCGMFSGQNPESVGIRKAQSLGVPTSFESIHAFEADPDCAEIVFDATSAEVHRRHAPILEKMGKFVIDMTPSRIGKMCVPSLNLDECLREPNISMITCGGQAMTPLAYAIMKVHPDTPYIEIVGSIASRSAGVGTRNNIDEYTQATRDAIVHFSGVPRAKAIIVLNPAEPPILMHNTMYAEIPHPDMQAITREVASVVERMRTYAPGYNLQLEPTYENGRVMIMNTVVGRGDFLPPYAGNLDIINCAAIAAAEAYARKKVL
ncbi:MAG: acetaldehyde dehydrogenase (acetylating) [Patescibacteria group bacterium]